MCGKPKKKEWAPRFVEVEVCKKLHRIRLTGARAPQREFGVSAGDVSLA